MTSSRRHRLLVGSVIVATVGSIGCGAALASTPNTDSTSPTSPPDSMVISPSPSSTAAESAPGFDAMTQRIQSSGAPDAVKKRILDRIDALRKEQGINQSRIAALGFLLGRSIDDSPLRQQIKTQLKLRLRQFQDQNQLGNESAAREQLRQIMNRFRAEYLAVLQERLHTRLQGIIARLPELPSGIDAEAWRTRLVDLEDKLVNARSLQDFRTTAVDVREALAELVRLIKASRK